MTLIHKTKDNTQTRKGEVLTKVPAKGLLPLWNVSLSKETIYTNQREPVVSLLCKFGESDVCHILSLCGINSDVSVILSVRDTRVITETEIRGIYICCQGDRTCGLL